MVRRLQDSWRFNASKVAIAPQKRDLCEAQVRTSSGGRWAHTRIDSATRSLFRRSTQEKSGPEPGPRHRMITSL